MTMRDWPKGAGMPRSPRAQCFIAHGEHCRCYRKDASDECCNCFHSRRVCDGCLREPRGLQCNFGFFALSPDHDLFSPEYEEYWFCEADCAYEFALRAKQSFVFVRGGDSDENMPRVLLNVYARGKRYGLIETDTGDWKLFREGKKIAADQGEENRNPH